MISYGLYARKSRDDKKATQKSIGEQLAEGRALADREGLLIAWTAEESKSAKVPGVRPLFRELIALINQGKLDGIICWQVNRLVRNMKEGGELAQLLIDGKIKEIRTPHATYRSGDNILPMVVDTASATQYSLDLRHTVARSQDANFRAGGWNHTAPPGYLNKRDAVNVRRGVVKPDGRRFSTVRKAWDLFLTESVSPAALCRTMEHEWGFRVHQTPKRPARPLRYSALLKMLRNPFYAGFVREKGILVPGQHIPMITLQEFDQAQRILSRRTPARSKHIHHFAGLMRCGYCGQMVTAETKHLKSGKDWEIYHCSDSYHRCTQRGITSDEVDRQLASHFGSIRASLSTLEFVVREIKRTLSAVQDAMAKKSSHVADSLQTIETKLNRLSEMWIAGMLTDEERYRTLEANLQKERAHLQLNPARNQEDRVSSALRNLDKTVQLIEAGELLYSSMNRESKAAAARCLGTYSFFGREKRIELQLRPILREMLLVIRSLSPSLEPSDSDSESQHPMPRKQEFAFGRTEASTLEIPESLIQALIEDQVPKLSESELGSVAGKVIVH